MMMSQQNGGRDITTLIFPDDKDEIFEVSGPLPFDDFATDATTKEHHFRTMTEWFKAKRIRPIEYHNIIKKNPGKQPKSKCIDCGKYTHVVWVDMTVNGHRSKRNLEGLRYCKNCESLLILDEVMPDDR